MVSEFPISDLFGGHKTALIFGFTFLMNVQIYVSPCPPRLMWPVGNVWFVFISPSFLEQGLRPHHISYALHPRLFWTLKVD